MTGSYEVQVHQVSRAPSVSSSSSTYSSSSSNRSPTPGVYRDHEARKSRQASPLMLGKALPASFSDKHSTKISRAGSTTIINHGKTNYDDAYTSPPYRGAYAR